jgi:radical SAM superfamily enzyme YgiQ (UPF0313 family)
MKKDVVLFAIPLMEVKWPAPAIYHLKGQIEADGKTTCAAIDANVLIYDSFKYEWNDIVYMLHWHTPDPMWDLYKKVITRLKEIFTEYITLHDPEWVAISIFSLNSRRVGTDIIKFVREQWPNKKILIGGTGLGDALGDTAFEYANKLLADKLIDYYITGEGEVAVVELICKNNPNAVGINRPNRQIQNLEGLAFANYDECVHSLYPFEKYDSGKPTYILTGSRGCVRRCDFCDVYRLWPKFKTRGGEHMAKEMIYHYEKKGVDTFYLSDSLVNGSMKAFRELVDVLLKYQEDHNMKFRWGGQFIARTNSQMSTEDYMRASAAGLENVGIGLEHASERMRKLMRKGFDNDALYDTIHNLSKSRIYVMFNILFGHPLETEEDFEENIKFLHDFKWASDDGTIAALNLQHYIAFLPGTDFADNKDDLVVDDVGTFWKSKHISTLDFPEIYRRRKRMSDVCKDLNWKTFNEEAYMSYMERELLYYYNTKEEHEKQK